ncbi:MAG: helix-turn-helix domain-containing protein [Pseudonocardia sp.]
MAEDRQVLSSGELAKLLGVSRRTITRWASDGMITPAVTLVGGQHRWDPDDVKRQLRELRQRDE